MTVALAHGLVSLWFSAVTGAAGGEHLVTLASASLRPMPCRVQASEQRSALWARTAGGAARSFCELMARGQIRLERSPEQALALADEAQKLLPGEGSPLVLGARALLRLGEFARAFERFDQSQRRQGQPFADAATLREFAVSAARSGRTEQAISLYRRLIPRSDFGYDPRFRRLVVLEAASLFAASGPAGLADAEVYLSEARRGAPAPGLEDLTSALLALVLDREGSLEQAQIVIEDIAGPWGLERFLSPSEAARAEGLMLSEEAPAEAPKEKFTPSSPSLAQGELHAALAVVAAASDPKFSRIHLRAFLERAANGPWSAWARAKLPAPRGAGQ